MDYLKFSYVKLNMSRVGQNLTLGKVLDEIKKYPDGMTDRQLAWNLQVPHLAPHLSVILDVLYESQQITVSVHDAYLPGGRISYTEQKVFPI